MKRILVSIVFALLVGLPFAASAQDTPTPDVATIEASPVVTETPAPEPTAAVEPTPAQEPEEPAPTSTNWSLIIPWIGAAILAAAIGVFVVLRTAFVQLGKSAPLPAWEVAKGTSNTLYEQLLKLVGKTPNTTDDFLAGEVGKLLEGFVKEVDDLRAKVNVLEAQVAVNKSDIAVQSQSISNR